MALPAGTIGRTHSSGSTRKSMITGLLLLDGHVRRAAHDAGHVAATPTRTAHEPARHDHLAVEHRTVEDLHEVGRGGERKVRHVLGLLHHPALHALAAAGEADLRIARVAAELRHPPVAVVLLLCHPLLP